MQQINPKLKAIAYFIIGGLLFFSLYKEQPEAIDLERVVIFEHHPEGFQIQEELGLEGYSGFEMIPFNMLDKPLSATHLHRSIDDFDNYAVFIDTEITNDPTIGFMITVEECLTSPSTYRASVNEVEFAFSGSCNDKSTTIQFIEVTNNDDRKPLFELAKGNTLLDLRLNVDSNFSIRFSMKGVADQLKTNLGA